jgi:predicted nucleic acid-binding protein
MILDSSFLIDLMDQDAGVVAKTGGIDRDQLTVPTLVCTEVGTGFDAGSSQAEAFEAMVADVTLAPYDAEAPRHAVSIRRQLSGQGRHIGAVDTMIAGTSAGITTRKQEPRTSTFTHLQMQRVRIQSRRVSPSKSRSWSRERSTNSGSGRSIRAVSRRSTPQTTRRSRARGLRVHRNLPFDSHRRQDTLDPYRNMY